jgi:hypothetical protein
MDPLLRKTIDRISYLIQTNLPNIENEEHVHIPPPSTPLEDLHTEIMSHTLLRDLRERSISEGLLDWLETVKRGETFAVKVFQRAVRHHYIELKHVLEKAAE